MCRYVVIVSRSSLLANIILFFVIIVQPLSWVGLRLINDDGLVDDSSSLNETIF